MLLEILVGIFGRAGDILWFIACKDILIIVSYDLIAILVIEQFLQVFGHFITGKPLEVYTLFSAVEGKVGEFTHEIKVRHSFCGDDSGYYKVGEHNESIA